MKKLTLILATSLFAVSPALANPAQVSGSVAPSCSISNAPTTVAFGALDTYGQATAPIVASGIVIFCNEPATIGFTSMNGYLAHDSEVPASETDLESTTNPGFNAAVDYSYIFDASVVNTSGNPIGWATTGNFQTAGATANFSVSATNAPAASLTYSTLPASNGYPALSGTYSDELEVSITPAGF